MAMHRFYFQIFLSLVLLSISTFSVGQNLVPNGGFEEFNECPPNFSTHPSNIYVKYWSSPSAGTPDYFNPCSKMCGVPRNYIGYAEAKEGNAYMGLIACMEQINEKQIPTREYIRVELKEPLKANETYYASMYVRLGLSCIASCNGLGMFFSSKALNTPHQSHYPVPLHIEQANSEVIQNTEVWQKICGTYIASGGEQYLFIGNFFSNKEMKYVRFREEYIETRNISPMAYFYIDDVMVEVFDASKDYQCDQIKRSNAFAGVLESGERYILKNLYFETDKAIIKEESFEELNKLASYLLENSELNILIEGHTDDTGNDEYNQQLSESRASAVWQYLKKQGVSPDKMQKQGFGSSKPIATNNTTEGKEMNRRVELKVL